MPSNVEIKTKIADLQKKKEEFLHWRAEYQSLEEMFKKVHQAFQNQPREIPEVNAFMQAYQAHLETKADQKKLEEEYDQAIKALNDYYLLQTKPSAATKLLDLDRAVFLTAPVNQARNKLSNFYDKEKKAIKAAINKVKELVKVKNVVKVRENLKKPPSTPKEKFTYTIEAAAALGTIGVFRRVLLAETFNLSKKQLENLGKDKVHLSALKAAVNANESSIEKLTNLLKQVPTPPSIVEQVFAHALQYEKYDAAIVLAGENENLKSKIRVKLQAYTNQATWSENAQELINLVKNNKSLLQFKFDNRNTLLHFALLNNDPAVVELFAAMQPLAIGEQNNDGKTPIHLAAERNDSAEVQAVIGKYNGSPQSAVKLDVKQSPSGTTQIGARNTAFYNVLFHDTYVATMLTIPAYKVSEDDFVTVLTHCSVATRTAYLERLKANSPDARLIDKFFHNLRSTPENNWQDYILQAESNLDILLEVVSNQADQDVLSMAINKFSAAPSTLLPGGLHPKAIHAKLILRLLEQLNQPVTEEQTNALAKIKKDLRAVLESELNRLYASTNRKDNFEADRLKLRLNLNPAIKTYLEICPPKNYLGGLFNSVDPLFLHGLDNTNNTNNTKHQMASHSISKQQYTFSEYDSRGKVAANSCNLVILNNELADLHDANNTYPSNTYVLRQVQGKIKLHYISSEGVKEIPNQDVHSLDNLSKILEANTSLSIAKMPLSNAKEIYKKIQEYHLKSPQVVAPEPVMSINSSA